MIEDVQSIKTRTKKLYYDDMYTMEFKAVVTKIDGNRIFLDQTAFFPRSGGQEGDYGIISQHKVVTTYYYDGDIAHECEPPIALEVGQTVECQIDWDKRYRTMRLHSAGHLMEHFLFQKFGELERTGSNVNQEAERSTYKASISGEELAEAQERLNKFLDSDYPISCRYIDIDKEQRLWSCAGIDVGCGGTHPKSTKEIGKVDLRRKSAGKGLIKIYTTLQEN